MGEAEPAQWPPSQGVESMSPPWTFQALRFSVPRPWVRIVTDDWEYTEQME